MNIKRFLCSIKSEVYRIRLNRVDLTVDYQNWDISVNDIYHKLGNKYLEMRDHKDEINHSEISAYETNGKVSTFYVGSKKAGRGFF